MIKSFLVPEYIEKFSCIGKACEDNCCKSSWRIDIDKNTYIKYKNSGDIKLSKLVVKNKGINNNRKYAYLKKDADSDKRCTFLTEEGYCGIHQQYGESYLSNTCRTYPRMYVEINNTFEMSLTLSCPEAARQVLFLESGIKLINKDINVDDSILFTSYKIKNDLTYNIHQYFWDIRILSMEILQNRDYSMSERMILLGILYDNLQSSVDRYNTENIILNFRSMMEDSNLKESLTKIPKNFDIQKFIVEELVNYKIGKGLFVQRYVDVLNDTISGFKNGTFEEMLKYNKENFLDDYLRDREYIMENFIVNEFFRRTMPIFYSGNIWESYVYLAVIYSFVYIHLIGVAGTRKSMNDEIVVEVIQAISKAILHDLVYISNIIEMLKINKMNTLSYMSVLVNI